MRPDRTGTHATGVAEVRRLRAIIVEQATVIAALTVDNEALRAELAELAAR